MSNYDYFNSWDYVDGVGNYITLSSKYKGVTEDNVQEIVDKSFDNTELKTEGQELQLSINGKNVSTVTIEDKYLRDVSFNEETKELIFKVDSEDSDDVKTINLASLLDEFATKADIDTKVSELINGAPEALDTLQELSTALGEDPNFAATMATELSKKLDKETYDIDKRTFVSKDDLALKADVSLLENYVENSAFIGVSNKTIENAQKIDAINQTIQEVSNNLGTLNTNVSESINALNKNMADGFNTINGGIDNELRPEIQSNKQAIENEIERAKEAEKNIDETIITINTNLANSVDIINKNVADGFNTINGGIENEIKPSIETITNNLTAEVDRAKEVEKQLNDNLVSVNTNVANAITTINQNVVDAVNTINGGIDNEIRPELEKAVKYIDVADANLPNRKAVLFKNGDVLLGNLPGDDKGNVALVQLNRWGVADFGSPKVQLNLNTPKDVRPTVQEQGQTGEEAHKIAYLSDIESKVAKVEIIQDVDNSLHYTLMVDDNAAGEINIPKDQFLKSVEYLSDTKEIKFVFDTKEGDIETKVDISDLVDTYTAGDGLNLEDNKFSVKLDSTSESFLSVSVDGIKISGISDAISSNISEAKKELIGSENDADTVETIHGVKNYINSEMNKVNTILNLGNVSTSGVGEDLAKEQAFDGIGIFTYKVGAANGIILNYASPLGGATQVIYWDGKVGTRTINADKTASAWKYPKEITTLLGKTIQTKKLFALTTSSTSDEVKEALTYTAVSETIVTLDDLNNCLKYGLYLSGSGVNEFIKVGFSGQGFQLTLVGQNDPGKTFKMGSVILNISEDGTYSCLTDGSLKIIASRDDIATLKESVDKKVEFEVLEESYGIQNRKVITFDNGELIQAQANTEELENKVDVTGAISLIQLNRWNVVDIGSTKTITNINTPKDQRPTVQEEGQSGPDAHKIAYLSDVETLTTQITELLNKVTELETEIANLKAQNP